MAYIDWTEKNEVGIEVVDEQHQRLFDMLNRLHESVVQGAEQGSMLGILDELIEYTVYHFKTEEEIWAGHPYPGAEAHKKEHDALTQTAVELRARLDDGSATLSFEVLDFLNGWLMDHTIGTDSEMGEALKGVV